MMTNFLLFRAIRATTSFICNTAFSCSCLRAGRFRWFLWSGCDTAVRYFQGRYGLAVDGSVGPATWNKMKELITEIQQALYNFNDPDVKISIINGIAGPETYNAVCFFQAKVGLSVDGSVGPATRAILFSDSSGSTRPTDGLPLTSGCTGCLSKIPIRASYLRH